jgi:thiol-disulfide isomerase/thioredoxin
MILRRVACAAFAVLAVACTQQRPLAQHARAAVIPARPEAGRVPDFEVYAVGGVRYSSQLLVGKQPFVAVFFATWCDYCQGELKTIERAFHEIGPMPVIPVSVDGPETWGQVPAYLASFGIHAPAVRASHYRRFAATYNPADILPSVAIVGRNGALVDYLHGYDPAHAERLLASLRHAKAVPPLPPGELTASNLAVAPRNAAAAWPLLAIP